MSPSTRPQFDALSDYLASRRKAILLAWRKAADADPKQTTGRSLTRGQFNDHVPEVLDAFEYRLRSRAGGANARAAEGDQKQEEVKHGLHRWQQGYRLPELTQEWGHLQLCLFEELETFAATHPDIDRETLAEANRQMITLVNNAIGESAAQFARMQQAEAAGHMEDLKDALASVTEIESRRAALIHEAVHDINGNVFGVSVAAKLLGGTRIDERERLEFSKLLEQGVRSVSTMLQELMELARLEAGQELREISGFDVAVLITALGDTCRPMARQRGLFLEVKGPAELGVEGDPGKVRRLLQNLLLNSIKYTNQGGVILSWGEEKENWWLMVKDTGPGMVTGTDAPMTAGLKEATASARESDEKSAATTGESSHVLTPSHDARTDDEEPPQPGEGVGLSIVKRLCELLDASLEMASSAKTGTTFRVVFPRRYRDDPVAE